MSDSVRPHRQQPTRLRPTWDSPGKNTGVGCHFLLQCMKNEKWKWSCSVVSDSMRPHRQQPTRPLWPWDFPGKCTGVACHCLLWVQSLDKRYLSQLSTISINSNKLCLTWHPWCEMMRMTLPLWSYSKI